MPDKTRLMRAIGFDVQDAFTRAERLRTNSIADEQEQLDELWRLKEALLHGLFHTEELIYALLREHQDKTKEREEL